MFSIGEKVKFIFNKNEYEGEIVNFNNDPEKNYLVSFISIKGGIKKYIPERNIKKLETSVSGTQMEGPFSLHYIPHNGEYLPDCESMKEAHTLARVFTKGNANRAQRRLIITNNAGNTLAYYEDGICFQPKEKSND